MRRGDVRRGEAKGKKQETRNKKQAAVGVGEDNQTAAIKSMQVLVLSESNIEPSATHAEQEEEAV